MNAGQTLDRADAVPLEEQTEAENKLLVSETASVVRVRFGERLAARTALEPLMTATIAPETAGFSLADGAQHDESPSVRIAIRLEWSSLGRTQANRLVVVAPVPPPSGTGVFL